MNPVIRFFILFLVVYLILTGISLIPAVGYTLGKVYSKAAVPVLRQLLPRVYLQSRSDESQPDLIWIEYAGKRQVEAQMQAASRDGVRNVAISGQNTYVQFYNLFLSFYLLFVSLMVISPLPLKEKILKIIAGTIVYFLFTVFKVWLQLFVILSRPEINIYSPSSAVLPVAEAVLSFLTLGVNLLFVLLLCGLLVFKRHNWNWVATLASAQGRGKNFR